MKERTAAENQFFLCLENLRKSGKFSLASQKKTFDRRAEVTCTTYVNNMKFEYKKRCYLLLPSNEVASTMRPLVVMKAS